MSQLMDSSELLYHLCHFATSMSNDACAICSSRNRSSMRGMPYSFMIVE